MILFLKCILDNLIIPINVFGNSSTNKDNKTDTSLFVQKPYLRSNYIEANIEEDIDSKNQCRIKNSPDSISIREPASQNYVKNLFNDPSIIKNTAYIDLNVEILPLLDLFRSINYLKSILI